MGNVFHAEVVSHHQFYQSLDSFVWFVIYLNDAIVFLGIVDTTGALTDVFTDKFFTKDQIGNFTAMTPGLIDVSLFMFTILL